MALCPVSGTPCCDDLCYGGGCLESGEERLPMLHKCGACGYHHSDEDECDVEYDEELEMPPESETPGNV
jgi:hypothetical protein